MSEEKHHKSAMKVNPGIAQPPSVNVNAIKNFKRNKKSRIPTDEMVSGILQGDRTMLSRAITLVESSLPDHQQQAQAVIEQCLPHAGNSIRIGITGIPGVGKSTFIEAIGSEITAAGHKLAVLAIDPSSERSKGSILGDKTRMESLTGDPNAFIRPSPSAGTLGGVARKTRESIVLCEAAGFDAIFIETVGVGQSETAVRSMVDFFLLLMLAGAGDELQGIKRGIMEMADAIAITKADGQNEIKARQAKREYENALDLFPLPESKWKPKVLTSSSVSGHGLTDIWQTIKTYVSHTRNNTYFEQQRRKQAKYWMYESIHQALRDDFYNTTEVKEKLERFENKVLNDELTSFVAARKLLDLYFGKKNSK